MGSLRSRRPQLGSLTPTAGRLFPSMSPNHGPSPNPGNKQAVSGFTMWRFAQGGPMLRWVRGRGQAPEFEDVALVHLDLLYRTALRLTHNRAEAEDLVQETWVRALRHFDQFDPGSNCRAWLVTILRNAFLNKLRREGRERLESEAAGDSGGSAAFEDSAV